MFGKMKFRVITQYSQQSASNIVDLLKKEGFKVQDLKESEIVNTSDNSKVQSVYIICCKGEIKEFERFKHKHQFTEIIYEGFRTLM